MSAISRRGQRSISKMQSMTAPSIAHLRKTLDVSWSIIGSSHVVNSFQVSQSRLQFAVHLIEFFGGSLEMIGHVRLVGGLDPFDPNMKLVRMFSIVLDPMRQQRAQLFNISHGLPRCGSPGAVDVSRT